MQDPKRISCTISKQKNVCTILIYRTLYSKGKSFYVISNLRRICCVLRMDWLFLKRRLLLFEKDVSGRYLASECIEKGITVSEECSHCRRMLLFEKNVSLMMLCCLRRMLRLDENVATKEERGCLIGMLLFDEDVAEW